MGGWRFGNTIDGAQAEYLLVPHAAANLTPVPDGLTGEQVLMCPDSMSTGFSGAESGGIRIGDTVAVRGGRIELGESFGEAQRTGRPAGDALREFSASLGASLPVAYHAPFDEAERQGADTVDRLRRLEHSGRWGGGG